MIAAGAALAFTWFLFMLLPFHVWRKWQNGRPAAVHGSFRGFGTLFLTVILRDNYVAVLSAAFVGVVAATLAGVPLSATGVALAIFGVQATVRLNSAFTGRYAETASASFRRLLSQHVSRLDHHTVLVGYGSLGRRTAAHLVRHHVSIRRIPLPGLENLLVEIDPDLHLGRVPLAKNLVIVEDEATDVLATFPLSTDVACGVALIRAPVPGRDSRFVAVPVIVGDAGRTSVLASARLQQATIAISTTAETSVSRNVVELYREILRPSRNAAEGPGPTIVMAHSRFTDKTFLVGDAVRTQSLFLYPAAIVAEAFARRLTFFWEKARSRCAASSPHDLPRVLLVGRGRPLLQAFESFAQRVARLLQCDHATLHEYIRTNVHMLTDSDAELQVTSTNAEEKGNDLQLTTRGRGKGQVEEELSAPISIVSKLDFERIERGIETTNPHCIGVCMPDDPERLRDVVHDTVRAIERIGHQARQTPAGLAPHLVIATPDQSRKDVARTLYYHDHSVARTPFEGFPRGIVDVNTDAKELIVSAVDASMRSADATDGSQRVSFTFCLSDRPGAWAAVLEQMAGLQPTEEALRQLTSAKVPLFYDLRVCRTDPVGQYGRFLVKSQAALSHGTAIRADYESHVRAALGFEPNADQHAQGLLDFGNQVQLAQQRDSAAFESRECEHGCPAVGRCPITHEKRWLYAALDGRTDVSAEMVARIRGNSGFTARPDESRLGGLRPFACVDVIAESAEHAGALAVVMNSCMLRNPYGLRVKDSPQRVVDINYAATEQCENKDYAFDRIQGVIASASREDRTRSLATMASQSPILAAIVEPASEFDEWEEYCARMTHVLNLSGSYICLRIAKRFLVVVRASGAEPLEFLRGLRPTEFDDGLLDGVLRFLEEASPSAVRSVAARP